MEHRSRKEQCLFRHTAFTGWGGLGNACIHSRCNEYLRQKAYKLLDEYPLNQMSYYRLQQVDLDGRTKISPVVKIELENRLNYTVKVYPNPTSQSIVFQGNAEELNGLMAYDMVGRSMDLSSITILVNANKLILNLSSWLPGIYFFRTKSNNMKVIKT